MDVSKALWIYCLHDMLTKEPRPPEGRRWPTSLKKNYGRQRLGKRQHQSSLQGEYNFTIKELLPIVIAACSAVGQVKQSEHNVTMQRWWQRPPGASMAIGEPGSVRLALSPSEENCHGVPSGMTGAEVVGKVPS